jgi:hypothetical protein
LHSKYRRTGRVLSIWASLQQIDNARRLPSESLVISQVGIVRDTVLHYATTLD